MSADPILTLCTFRREAFCGMVAEEESVHSWPHERMRVGTHLWRHDPKMTDALRAALRATPAAPKEANRE